MNPSGNLFHSAQWWIRLVICAVAFALTGDALNADSAATLPKGALQQLGSGRFHVNGTASQVEVSADGSLIFVQSGSELVVLDRESGRVIEDVRHQPGRGSIWRIASSQDSKLLAIAITDFNARPAESFRVVVLNTQTRQRKVLRSKGRRSPVLFLKISPDHQFIVAGTETDGLRFWNLESGEEIPRPAITTQIIHVAAFSPDGKTLTVMGEDITLQWKWQTDEKPIQLTQHSQMRPAVLEYSPDGSWMFVGYHEADGLRVLHAGNGESAWSLQLNRKLINPVYHMAFTNDSRFIAVPMSGNNSVDLWDLQTRRKVGSFLCWEPRTVAMTQDGRWLVAGGQGSKVTVFDFATRRAMNTLPDGHDSWVTKIRFTKDGQSLVSASDDGSAIVWEVRTGQPASRLSHGQGNLVSGLAVSPDADQIVTSTFHDQTMRFWKRVNDRYVLRHKRTLKQDSNWFDIRFAPDGQRFATWDSSRHLCWWNALDGKLLENLPITLPRVEFDPLQDNNDLIPTGQFTADATRLNVVLAGTLFGFDTKTGEQNQEIELKGFNDAIQFSPDGKSLVSTSFPQESDSRSDLHQDVIIRLHEYPSLKIIQQITLPDIGRVGMAFSPDSNILACSGNRSQTMIDLINLKTGQVTGRIEGVPHFVLLQFSPDGKRIATAHSNSTIILWDLSRFPAKEPTMKD